MYKKFDIRDYQKGGKTPQKHPQMSDERDKIKAFYNDMLNSQWYKDRLKNNGYNKETVWDSLKKFFNKDYSKIDNIVKTRLDYINETSVERGNKPNETGSLNRMRYLKPHHIYLHNPEMDRYKINPSRVLAHEYGHSEVNEFRMDNNMSDEEYKMYRKKVPNIYRIIEPHNSDPYEMKSDINTIRYHLFRRGLFDPKTGKYKTKDGRFDETLLKHLEGEIYYERLRDINEDRHHSIKRLLNTVAKNKPYTNFNYV